MHRSEGVCSDADISALLVVLALDANIFLIRHIELLRQLAIASRKLVEGPGPMPMPLTEDEHRRLHLEGERHRLEWRGVLVAPEIVDQALVAALILTGTPVGVIADPCRSDD